MKKKRPEKISAGAAIIAEIQWKRSRVASSAPDQTGESLVGLFMRPGRVREEERALAARVDHQVLARGVGLQQTVRVRVARAVHEHLLVTVRILVIVRVQSRAPERIGQLRQRHVGQDLAGERCFVSHTDGFRMEVGICPGQGPSRQRFFLSMVPRQPEAPQWQGKRRFTAGVIRSWVIIW